MYTNNTCPLCNQIIDMVYVMKNEDLTNFMRKENIDKIDEELTKLEINCKNYKEKKEELEKAREKLQEQLNSGGVEESKDNEELPQLKF